MPNDYTVFNIPAAEQEPAQVFGAPATEPAEISSVYTELNQIAEELEECRLRNC